MTQSMQSSFNNLLTSFSTPNVAGSRIDSGGIPVDKLGNKINPLGRGIDNFLRDIFSGFGFDTLPQAGPQITTEALPPPTGAAPPRTAQEQRSFDAAVAQKTRGKRAARRYEILRKQFQSAAPGVTPEIFEMLKPVEPKPKRKPKPFAGTERENNLLADVRKTLG